MGLLIFILATIIGAFTYFEWLHSYWKRRGIDGPKGWPFLGSFYEVSNRSLPRNFVFKKWTKQFGKVFGYYEGAHKNLVISDLDMLQEMFVKKFDYFYARKSTNVIHGDLESTVEEPQVSLFGSRGSRWKRFRSLASPCFSVKSLKQVHHIVEDSAICLMDLFKEHVDGKAFNIHNLYFEFTFDVICRLSMGQPNSEMLNNPGMQIVKNIFAREHRTLPWYLSVLFPKYEFNVKQMFYNHESVKGGDVAKLLAYCKTSVEKRIELRNENVKLGIENQQSDFIDIYLDCYADIVEDVPYGTTIEKKITFEEIISGCFMFLLAGFDTTGNGLGYVTYLLAKNPEKMKKVQKEIEENCQNESVSYDDLTKLPYTEAAIKEALRLYPVAAFAASRECVKTTTLGNLKIEKGTRIEADVLSIHRSKEIWGDNVDDYVPERWLTDSSRHLMSWIPFGAGPRLCVGMRLAMVEIKLVLSLMLRQYDLVATEDTEEELHLSGNVTTSPDSVTVALRSRF
ncbi:unnamed protein product [Caenorhabditis angaria]|uniref:Cytochrome P450 n=1 Tax=Caenorhabditis angaria TaxID=860376 RepID=A0A9P1J3S1_9PELO|nr:unnamed protein product [Caenorhabditis angaria]